ncbi:MAG: hypothetical protein RL756_2283 [Pseudomonadota bacterium]|jgi:uncharacterized phiE125 gp8 family phage protein
MGWKVIAEPTVEPVSLSEAKLHLRVDGSTEDALITRLITAAREECEQATDRSISAQTILLTLDGFAAGDIVLPRGPVTSVTHVKYKNESGTLITLSSAAYIFDDSGVMPALRLPYGGTWPVTLVEPQAVQITYAAGWAANVCPSALKQWIMLRVGSLFENREADSDRPAMESPFAQRIIDRWRVPGV